METRRGDGFLKSIRKEVSGVLAGLAGLGAASEAGARERGVEDKADDAFEEMDGEVAAEETTEADVMKNIERFQAKLVIEVGTNKAKGVLDTLDKDLKRPGLTLDDKLNIIRIYDQRLEGLLQKRNSAQKKSQVESPTETAEDKDFSDLSESSFGLGNYFDDSVSYEDAIKTLNTLIPIGTSVEYNGIRFVKDRDGVLFCEGGRVTPDSRKKMIEAYEAVAEKMKLKGVELR